MSLREINLKASYDTGVDDVVESFYIPVLSKTCAYDRIAGFFTSTSLAVSARGLENLIRNKGKMRLLVSPYLNKDDVDVINNASLKPEIYITKSMSEVIDIENDESVANYRNLLGWMIANDMLEIKTVLIRNSEGKIASKEEVDRSALFHQKIGICQDEAGNILSFSGSINETASAWTKNIENFKVFKSWAPGQQEYCFDDVNSFNSYWNNKRENVIILDIPSAIKSKLIQYGDKDINEILNAINKVKSVKRNISIPLFHYQESAVEVWKNNGFHLLFEMATGTGKTRTAISCMIEMIKLNERNLFVVATPQSTLSQQWRTEVEKFYQQFNKVLIVDSTNVNAKKELKEAISRINIKTYNNVIIYTTHATCSTAWFKEELGRVKGCDVTFVGDEVHGLGSSKQQSGLLDKYKYRIGLSATPERFFDEEGSEFLRQYFGNKSYQFTIQDALLEINPLTNKTFLCPYYYYLRFSTLTDDEMEKYIYLSKKITKLSLMKNKAEENNGLTNLLFKRANIIKAAANKLKALEELVIELGPNIDKTIVFTSPEQIEDVLLLFKVHGVKAERFTQEVDSKVQRGLGKSERQIIIERFKAGEIKVLVAIKCLDEGIDIPEADTAILMASTKNPREYIQRIGRVIRNNEGKRYAHIYDFICKPAEYAELGDSILEKEIERSSYIAGMAINGVEATLKLYGGINN